MWFLSMIAGGVATLGAAQPGMTTGGISDQKIDAAKATAELVFQKRLESIDAMMAKVADLRANFEQVKRTPLLRKPIVSKGTLVAKGDRVRWETKSPRPSTMVVGRGEVRLYYPDDRLIEVYEAGGDAKDLAGAPLPRLSVLRERFEMSSLSVTALGGAENDPHLIALMLKPKAEELRRHIESVQVLIDESVPVATKVVMTDAEGEKTELSFTSVRLSTGVKDEEVDLQTPEGVRESHPLRKTSPPSGTPASPDKPGSTPPKLPSDKKR
jgi:outer membrane lipoprotein-sorting protein